MSKWLSIILMLLLAGVALVVGHLTGSPKSWTVHSTPGFTFTLPDNFQSVPVRGIDSYVAAYTNQNLAIDFDEGMYGAPNFNDMKDRPGFHSHIEQIGSMDVEIASFDAPSNSYPHTIAATFAKGRLVAVVRCRNTEDYETAAEIFRSVRYKPRMRLEVGHIEWAHQQDYCACRLIVGEDEFGFSGDRSKTFVQLGSYRNQWKLPFPFWSIVSIGALGLLTIAAALFSNIRRRSHSHREVIRKSS